MRAALVTTAIVLLVVLWYSRDRLQLDGVSLSPDTDTDVAAAPPDEAVTPPLPELPDERYATAATLTGDSRFHVVDADDTLWSIAVEHYGDGHRARAIYEANRDQIKDPGVLREGQVLRLPEAP